MSSKIDNICNDLFHAGKITLAEWTVISQSVQDYSHGEIIRTTGEAKLSLLADQAVRLTPAEAFAELMMEGTIDGQPMTGVAHCATEEDDNE